MNRHGLTKHAAGTVRATVSIANGLRFAEAETLEVAFGGSATKGEDYTVADGALTLPAWARSVGFDIQIAENTAEESEETAVVAVSRGGAAVAEANDSERMLIALSTSGDVRLASRRTRPAE